MAVLLPHYVLPLAGYVGSVDTWPLVHSAEKLARSPWLHILGKGFNDYDNHWPMLILLDLEASVVTGASPLIAHFYVVYGVLVVGFLLSYRVLLGRSHRGWLVAGAAAAMPVVFLFASSPLKELYFYPLGYLVAWLVTRDWWRPALFLLLPAVLSHPVTPIVLGLVLLVYALLSSMARWLAPWHGLPPRSRGASFVAVVLLSFTLIWGLLNKSVVTRLAPYIGLGDVVAYLLYVSAPLILVAMWYAKPPGKTGRGTRLAVLIAAFALYALLVPRLANVSDPVALLFIILYTLPFLVAALVASLGEGSLDPVSVLGHAAIIVSGTNILYTLFYLRLIGLGHRFAEHLAQALPLLGGRAKGKLQAVLLVTSILSSIVAVAAIAATGSYPLDPSWLYRPGELAGLKVLAGLEIPAPLYGGAKVAYYLQVIHNASLIYPLEAITSGQLAPRHSLVVIIADNLVHGMRVHGVTVPPRIIRESASRGSLVLCSGRVGAYWLGG